MQPQSDDIKQQTTTTESWAISCDLNARERVSPKMFCKFADNVINPVKSLPLIVTTHLRRPIRKSFDT